MIYYQKYFKKETHVLRDFQGDLYGSNLTTVILGYIRPMTSFNSLG
jgi:FAD synthase